MDRRAWLLLLTSLFAFFSGLLWGWSMISGFLPHVFPTMIFFVTVGLIFVFFETLRTLLRVSIFIDIPGTIFLTGLMVLGSFVITNAWMTLLVAIFLILISFLIEHATPR